jgi:chemotaxis protein MotB
MPRKRRHFETGRENTERWLLTYADLITLLLAFFIVMYSMSRVDALKFGEMTGALSGILRGTPAAPAGAGFGSTGGVEKSDTEALSSLEQAIERRLKIDGLTDRIVTVEDKRGLVIRVMESAAFDPGSADLKPQMFAVLSVLARELKDIPNQVRVEGHSDNTPIATARYPSNWELSTARATGVVRYLVEHLRVDPQRVSALGYAEYRPIASNQTPLGRARNRRVDIIILGDKRGEPGEMQDLPERPLADRDNPAGS